VFFFKFPSPATQGEEEEEEEEEEEAEEKKKERRRKEGIENIPPPLTPDWTLRNKAATSKLSLDRISNFRPPMLIRPRPDLLNTRSR